VTPIVSGGGKAKVGPVVVVGKPGTDGGVNGGDRVKLGVAGNGGPWSP
jgi:hypothetical protein